MNSDRTSLEHCGGCGHLVEEVERLREALAECVETLRAHDLPYTAAEDGARSALSRELARRISLALDEEDEG